MISEQCVSVSDLRKNMSAHLEQVQNHKPKVIFSNNKPIAVLISIEDYPLDIQPTFSFDFTPPLDPKEVLSHFGRI